MPELRAIPAGAPITSLARRILWAPWMIPNEDEIIQEFAPLEGIDFYFRLRRQVPYYSGLGKLRIDAVLALIQSILPGDPNDDESIAWAAACADAYNAIPDRIFAERRLLFSILDGFSVGEYVWGPLETNIRVERRGVERRTIARDFDMIVPRRLIDHKPVKFFYDKRGVLHYRAPDKANGVPLNPYSYVVSRFGSAREYGAGETQDVYVDVWKLDRIDKFSLEALERQGYPLVQVTVPEGWDQDRIESSTRWAKATHKNVIVVQYGDQFRVDTLSTAEGNRLLGSEYDNRIRDIKDNISIGLLGVSFSNAAAGSFARDKVRNEIRFEKTGIDATCRDAICQDFLDKVTEINRPDLPRRAWPKAKTDITPSDDQATRLRVYDTGQRMGFPISRAQFAEEFKLEAAADEADTLTRSASPIAAGEPGQNGEDGEDREIGFSDPGRITVLDERGNPVTFEDVTSLRKVLGV